MNFFTFRQSTDYILSVGITHYGETISNRLVVLPSGGIVVERSPIRSFAADYQFFVEALRIKPYAIYLISFYFRNIHACIFRYYVVVQIALRYSSN